MLAEKLSFLKNERLNISILLPSWFYIVQNRLHIKLEAEFIKENTYVTLKCKEDNEIINICIHSDSELTVPFDKEYIGCKHISKDDATISDIMFKKTVSLKFTVKSIEFLNNNDNTPEGLVDALESLKDKEIFGEENYNKQLLEILKEYTFIAAIPLIMESLEREYEETTINGKTYEILAIDSIWNYPARYISDHVYSHHEDYGMKRFTIESDPLATIIPELEKDRQFNISILDEYMNGNIPVYTLSQKNYEKYIGNIFRLMSDNRYNYLAGIGQSFEPITKYIISYSSLIILAYYDKLKYLPLDMLIIPNSFLVEIQRIFKEISDGIPIEQLSIALAEDSTLTKYESTPDENIELAKKWHELFNTIKKIETFETTDFIDDLTPFVRFIGKIEIDSIRLSSNLNIPLIIDDDFIHRNIPSRITTNVIPFYFQNSSESLFDKLNFINELSKNGYKYILYMGFCQTVIENFIDNDGLILGDSTPYWYFSENYDVGIVN